MKTEDKLISDVTLGTVQLGLMYGVATGKPSLERAFDILDTAWEGGVRSFDTSAKYGDSEEVLGKYFSSYENRSKKPFISTKFKLDPAVHTSSTAEKAIFETAECSMKRLCADRLDLLMLHNAEDLTRFGSVVPRTLEKLLDKGYIDMAGASLYTVDETEEILKNDVYTAVQIPMNVFDPRFIRSGMLDRLYDRKIKVFVRSVYLQGLFFFEPDELPPQFEFISGYIRKLNEISKETGLKKSHIVFSYIRDLDGVSSIVSGAETKMQIADTLETSKCEKISDDIRRQIYGEFGEVPIERVMIELRKIIYN